MYLLYMENIVSFCNIDRMRQSKAKQNLVTNLSIKIVKKEQEDANI